LSRWSIADAPSGSHQSPANPPKCAASDSTTLDVGERTGATTLDVGERDGVTMLVFVISGS